MSKYYPKTSDSRDYPLPSSTRAYPNENVPALVVSPGPTKPTLLGETGFPFGGLTINNPGVVSTVEWREKGSPLAAQFTAANSEYLSITDNASLSMGDVDFTVAAWVYLDSKPANHTGIISKWTSTTEEYSLRWINTSDRFQFSINDGASTASIIGTNAGVTALGQWYLLFGFHDSTASEIGIAIYTANFTSEVLQTVAAGINPQDSTSPLELGRIGTSNFFDGRMDSVSIWRRLLTVAERTWLYNGSFGRSYEDIGESGNDGSNLKTSLEAWWELDEASGSRVDSHGANDLTDNNTVTQVAGIAEPKALTAFPERWAGSFVAANSESLSIASNNNLSIADEDFFVAAWVYLTDNSVDRVIAGKVGASPAGEWVLFYDQSADRFVFEVRDGAAVDTVAADALGSPSLHTWYLVYGWHLTTGSFIRISVNNGTINTAVSTVNPANTSDQFEIGAANSGGYWNGRIDEVGFWRRVVSNTERTWLYNSGAGRNYEEIGQGGNDGSDLRTSLEAWWSLDERFGQRRDSHGSNHLTDNNTVLRLRGAVDVGNFPDAVEAARYAKFIPNQFNDEKLFTLRVVDNNGNTFDKDMAMVSNVQVPQHKRVRTNQTFRPFVDATFAEDAAFITQVEYEVSGATVVARTDIPRRTITSGTHDGAGNSANLIDTTQDFLALGVEAGDLVSNTTDGSSANVTSITTTTNPNDTLVLDGLTGGTDNDFDASDAYTVEEEEGLILRAKQFETSLTNTGLHRFTLYVTDGFSTESSDEIVVEVI